MPIVEKIEVAPYSLPLKAPLKWGSGHVMPKLEHVLVVVTLSDGAMGIAEANPRPTIYGETPESVEAVIRRQIAPELVGQEIHSPEDIAAAIGRYALLKNNNSARAAVDMALWSALAQSQNTSLLQLLGATRDRVRVSYILGTGETDTVLQEVAQVYHAGVRVLKVKTGKDFERETDLIRQIKAAHPDMDCYIDANETYTADNAVDILAAFAELGVLYCEEPLPVHQLWERANVRERSALPLIGDDSCFTMRDLERELAFNTFDVLNIKPPRNGFTEGIAMLKAAQEAGKGVMMGSQASSILGCIHTLMMAALPGVAHPSEGTFWLKVDDASALPLVDGYVQVSDLQLQLDREVNSIKSKLQENSTPKYFWGSPDLDEAVQKSVYYLNYRYLSKLDEEMSHYLTDIAGAASIIQKSLEAVEYLDPALKYTNLNAATILYKTNDFKRNLSVNIAITQINANSFGFNFTESVDLVQIIRQAIIDEQKRPLHSAYYQDVTFRFEPPLAGVFLVGDASRLLQLLRIGIYRAMQSLENNNRTIRINIKLDEDNVVTAIQYISNSDSHPEQFQQGINLYYDELFVANYIVEQHHGRMWFETETDSGTTFYIALPLSQPDAKPLARDQ